jgi:glutathione S-transferase
MRARLALATCCDSNSLELREVVLKYKPQAMLEISPKGTVPVLQLPDDLIIEESLDIMLWAFKSNPDKSLQFFPEENQAESLELIKQNDGEFKWALDRYKYSDRYDEAESFYREKGEVFLKQLDDRLSKHTFLMGEEAGLVDLAIFPFVRQFAHVNKKWFDDSPYEALKRWLKDWLESPLFVSIMNKYDKWEEGQAEVYFP